MDLFDKIKSQVMIIKQTWVLENPLKNCTQGGNPEGKPEGCWEMEGPADFQIVCQEEKLFLPRQRASLCDEKLYFRNTALLLKMIFWLRAQLH